MNNSQCPELPLGYYRHFKGGIYRVEGLARDAQTEAWCVYYQCQYGDYSYWVRPLAQFLELVEREGHTLPRFSYLGATHPQAEQ
jgi:hypothetical protein